MAGELRRRVRHIAHADGFGLAVVFGVVVEVARERFLVDGHVVRGSIGSLLGTSGPMGVNALGVRSIGVNLTGERVAGVSGDGRSVLVAPIDVEGRAVEVASGARDLLPPAWDFMDRIWLADRAVGGAGISVVVGQQAPREIEVPGVN